MIATKYRAEGRCKDRYVKKISGSDLYMWCEQSLDNPRYDVAQGTCESHDLPDDIRKKCDEYNGIFYACKWPK